MSQNSSCNLILIYDVVSDTWKAIFQLNTIITVVYSSQQSLIRPGNSDLSNVTSVGEVVIARAHVTVGPRLRDAETRRVAGGWGVVKLSL